MGVVINLDFLLARLTSSNTLSDKGDIILCCYDFLFPKNLTEFFLQLMVKFWLRSFG